MNNSLLYSIAFSMMHGISTYSKTALIKIYGSAMAIFLERQKGTDAFNTAALNHKEILMAAWPMKAAAEELETMVQQGIEPTCLEDAEYPNRLYQCQDAPILLFSKGSRKWNLPHLISIVGTRNHTLYADKVIQELLEGIHYLNLGVVSGLALGIDGIVHQKACQLKIPNWGVMASGVDVVYPTQHQQLARKMMDQGGVISENPSSTLPLPFQFPKRNRIVAGMTDATIVIESQVHGGSMITAGLARGYNREVFAVPGKIMDQKSKGCLALVLSNTAQLYQSPTQLLENLGWAVPSSAKTTQTPLPFTLDLICQEILDTIAQQGPIHRDQLANAFNLNIGQLSTHLLTLELNGLILPHGGAFYSIR
ncbi:MAG: DNA-processing protein DprA [Sediminibacterium sp.]